jgi:NarL family two-component system sensor histidine kinase LiaS
LLLFSGIFFFSFPADDWSLLWKRQFLHLPFLFIVPVLAILFGFVVGLISGYYWRGEFLKIGDVLDDIQEGNRLRRLNGDALKETTAILERLSRLERRMAEQTLMTRKMAGEKAEIEEKAVQKIISEERNRLARELHDSVSQQLFAASMLMSTINESRPPSDDPESRQLKLVEQTIHQSQLEMRALFLHLRPVQLHGKALKDGMQELLTELRQKVPMKIGWTIEPITLDKGVEDHLFRILQESVSNTLRHAKAKSLDVLLIQREDFVIMRVVDDGIGFDVSSTKPGSYGLGNMRERAMKIGGRLKIVSLPNKGTSLEVKVPILGSGERSEHQNDNKN